MRHEVDIPRLACAIDCPWGLMCWKKYQDGTCKGRIENIFTSLANKPITPPQIEDNSIVTNFTDKSGVMRISGGGMKIKTK